MLAAEHRCIENVAVPRNDHHAKGSTMKSFKLTALSAALACCASLGVAHAASTMSKQEYSAQKARVEADYKAARQACDSSSGNAKDICVEEAKGQQKVAMAELVYQADPSAKHREQLAEARGRDLRRRQGKV
jgi:hypothetical protein